MAKPESDNTIFYDTKNDSSDWEMVLSLFQNQKISFFQLARHWLLFFENHKIGHYSPNGAAGRNAQGRWREI